MIYIPQAILTIRPVAEYLSWEPSTGAAGYYLLQAASPTGTFKRLNEVMVKQPRTGKVTFPLIGASGTMYYKVQAWDANGNMSESDVIPVTIK